MIAETVELTLNPCPLVGDPKLSPTVPIAPSLANSSSRRTNHLVTGLEKPHWLCIATNNFFPVNNLSAWKRRDFNRAQLKNNPKNWFQ
jgi:hypothetical protein